VILYLNEGNGIFTNILDHTLTTGEAHTAKLFDHDNDGDLDVLTVGNSYDYNGHNYLYINEGNSNSFVAILCTDRYSCATPYGTRICAKTQINGEYVTQTRELSPFDGNVSCKYSPEHFGLGDAETIDSLIIRWPSGHVDTYLNVKANQFYRAIEDDKLEIDFKATNYIQYSPAIPNVVFGKEGESFSINLSEHYRFIKGDTLPEISGDTLVFDSIYIENTNVVTASINSNILTLESGTENGESEIRVFVDAGFTKRMDRFTVLHVVGINTVSALNNMQVHPNPFSTSTTIEYDLTKPSTVQLTIYDYLGKQVEVIEKKQAQGKQQITWNAEGLPAGVYSCVIKTNQGTQTTKIIKLNQ